MMHSLHSLHSLHSMHTHPWLARPRHTRCGLGMAQLGLHQTQTQDQGKTTPMGLEA